VVAWSEYLKAARAVAAADDSTPQPPPPPPVLLLQTLVQAWPAAVRVSDNENYLPLHYLCTNQPALLSDVQLLVEVYPEALQDGTCGTFGLPISFPPMDVIQYLIDCYPQAAKTWNVFGQLPLHQVCCSERLEVAVLECFIQLWPEAVLVPLDYIKTPPPQFSPTYYNGNNDEESSVSMEDEDESKDGSYEMSMNDKDDDEIDSNDGDHAMNVQDQEGDEDDNEDDDENNNDQEDDSDDDDEGEEEEDDNNYYYYRTSNQNQEAAAANVPWQWLPLDIVCDTATAEQPLTMEIMLLMTNGTPPLHFACSQPCTTWFPYRKQTLEKLAALSAPEDWMQFHQGRLPLHCAGRAQAGKAILWWLMEQYPNVLRTCTTDTMDFPLHCYLSSSTITRTTTTSNSVPNSTTSGTTMTQNFSYVTGQGSSMWLWSRYSFLMVWYLVKQYPAVLGIANRTRWLPIHLVALHDVPLNILFYLASYHPKSLLQENNHIGWSFFDWVLIFCEW